MGALVSGCCRLVSSSRAAEVAPVHPPVPALAEFRQTVFSRDHGLPDNRILSLLQSRDGYLWVGTASGVARFDGVNFQVFSPDTHPEFVNDECAALAEGLDGSIWIGTEDGLLCLRGGRVRRFTEQDGLAHKRILSLCAARNGDVWIGTWRGLNRLRAGRLEKIPMNAGPEDGDCGIRGLYEDASGSVWCTSLVAIKRWDPKADQCLDYSVRNPEEYATLVSGDIHTNVWLKGAALFRWQGGRLQQVVRCVGGAALLAAQDGSVWMSGALTEDQEVSLFRLRDGRLVNYDQPDGLSDHRITALLEDQQRNLWIGTYAGGLNCWQPRRLSTLGRKDGLLNEQVRTLAPSRDGGFWIGTDEGIHQWRAGTIMPFAVPGRPGDPRIRALHEAGDGRLWVCTGGALEEWDGFRFTQHRWLRLVTGDKYRAVFADRQGIVWLGGESGLMRRQNGQWQQFTTTDGLPHNDVYVMCEDHAGRFWIGTHGGGVAWLDAARTAVAANLLATNLCALTINAALGLSHNEVRSLHADAAGFLWVGTERGLNRIDLRGLPAGDKPFSGPTPVPRVHAFTRRNGLFDDLVSEILEDDFGNLWISCSRGIYRISKRELNNLASQREREAGQSHRTGSNPPVSGAAGGSKPTTMDAGASVARLHCVVYDEGDGLFSTDISGQKSRSAGCRTSDGRLWFPNAKGVVSVDPRRILEGDLPPQVVIEHCLVDGEDCAGNDFTPLVEGGAEAARDLALSPGRARSLEIQYTAPTFRMPERVRFRYRLEGWETDWVDAGTRRAALYTNLRPGAYRFQVQAASNIGLWNQTGATLAFTIAPHFYQTWWFWPVMAGLGIVLVLSFVQWRLHEVRHMHELAGQAALAAERERIARDMHDDLGAGLTRLVLLGNAAKCGADAPTRSVLSRLIGEAAALVDQLGDLIWCTNHRFDTLDNLLAHLREYASKFLGDAGLSVRIEEPQTPSALPVTGYFRRQTLLMFKEILTNVVRHARAREVRIALRFASPAEDGVATLELEVADNGCGFNPIAATPARSHGLANLRARAAALQGRLVIQSVPGNGSTTRILLPLTPQLIGPPPPKPEKAAV